MTASSIDQVNYTTSKDRDKYVTSESFQSSYSDSGRMDSLLASRLIYNKDLPAIMAVKHAAKMSIPYGRWSCDDFSVVIFNRFYQPMFRRSNGVNEFMLPNTFINNIAKVEYFYDDLTSPVRYLLRKFKDNALSAEERKMCRKSLAICLSLLEDYYPENKGHACQAWYPFAFKK